MSERKRPVTLEDLLRLKRSERPAPEFWTEFDQQLRAKQLAALLPKRPWWHGFRVSWAGLGRLHMAAGAAAVLAVTFVAWRDDGLPRVRPVDSGADVPVAVVASENAVAMTTPAAGADVANLRVESLAGLKEPAVATVPMVAMAELSTAVDGPVAAETPLAPIAEVTYPVFESRTLATGAEASSPSARFIAANLAAAQETVGVQLLGEMTGYDAGLLARPAKVEPLQHMTPPGEARRSNRYLTAMVSMAATDPSAETTERMARRISPEELYDQVRRFGTRQGGLNVRF